MTTAPAASATETRYRGEPAITLRAGELAATFVPDVGMTGVSLRLGRDEYLALPGGLAALRAGHTAGLPLLAPWANRLGSWRYRAAGVDVDLTGRPIGTDGCGHPIHGLLLGKPGWRVVGTSARRGAARLHAVLDVDAPEFPFPHRIEIAVTARDARLEVDTTVVATARRSVPVAFGWHPILRVPARAARREWQLRLPARRHWALDADGIPTGSSSRERAEEEPIGRRELDDLYELGRDHRCALRAEDGTSIELRSSASYRFAQVWVPRGRTFAALEPMTVPTNALASGTTPLVPPGESFTARFSLSLTGPDSTA